MFLKGGKSKQRKESQGGREKIGTSKFIEKFRNFEGSKLKIVGQVSPIVIS